MTLKSDYNYFADRDYSDYRELICYERPTAVLLHYEHDITYLRLWLYDRFDFEWKNGELVNRSNAFDVFLKKSGIVKYDIADIKLDEVEEFIHKLFNDGADAVLINYFSQIGESTVISTLMLEKNKTGLLATSLRGDSFYVRRLISFNDLKHKLHMVNNSFEYFTIHTPNSFPKIGHDHTLTDISFKFELDSLFNDKVKDYLKHSEKDDSVTGSDALKVAFEDRIKDFDFWKSKIDIGFDNALLVEFFWPIQFTYKPFLIYLGYLERNNLISHYFNHPNKGEEQEQLKLIDHIRTLLKKCETNSEILSNIGILFGKRPTEKRFNDFVNQFRTIIETYNEIEVILFPMKQNKSRGFNG
jgi:hypothetical protein